MWVDGGVIRLNIGDVVVVLTKDEFEKLHNMRIGAASLNAFYGGSTGVVNEIRYGNHYRIKPTKVIKNFSDNDYLGDVIDSHWFTMAQLKYVK